MSPWILDESIGCNAVAQPHKSMPEFHLRSCNVVFPQYGYRHEAFVPSKT